MRFTVNVKDYDLAKTLECGQVFRFHKQGDAYRLFASNMVCTVSQQGTSITLECSKTDTAVQMFWMRYFGFTDNLTEFYALMNQNSFLKQVALENSGLRVLHQDKFEVLISFIISQNNNISKIKSSIEKVCWACGKSLGGEEYAFPTAEELLQVNLECAKLGYRLGYVLNIAEAMLRGELNLDSLTAGRVSYKRALQELCSYHGIGVKVANCVALFGLGHSEAFPIDVHMKRVLALPEMQGVAPESFGKYAGLLQQYLFNWALQNNL